MPDPSKKLDGEPARELTERECAKIIGGTLGGLSEMAPGNTIYNALEFWMRNRQVCENAFDATFVAAVKRGTVIPKT